MVTPKGTYKRKPDLPEGYVFGRPTKYKKEYCQMLIDHMAQGYSFKSFAGIITTDEATIARWVLEFPDFCAAKMIGKAKERVIWEKLHLKCCATGEGSMSGIIWAQKNKFPEDYKDTSEKNIAFSGDFKQLIATMDATQLHDLVSAIATQTAALEATHDTANNTNENIGNNSIRAESQKAPKNTD